MFGVSRRHTKLMSLIDKDCGACCILRYEMNVVPALDTKITGYLPCLYHANHIPSSATSNQHLTLRHNQNPWLQYDMQGTTLRVGSVVYAR